MVRSSAYDWNIHPENLRYRNRDDYNDIKPRNDIGLEDFGCLEINESKALGETRFIDEHSVQLLKDRTDTVVQHPSSLFSFLNPQNIVPSVPVLSFVTSR